MRYIGSYAYGWSILTSWEANGAYSLGMHIQNVNALASYDRYYAFPVQDLLFLLLSYVRSGYINLTYGSLRHAGVSAYGWSLFAQLEVNGAYSLGMHIQNVSPSSYDNCHHAFPVG